VSSLPTSGVQCRASQRRAFQRRAWGVRVKHRDRASVRLSTVERTGEGLQCRQHRLSSIERSSRASGVGHSNVERGAFESSIGIGLASDCRLSRGRARGYSVGSIDCRASSVRVERRASGIPTSSVERSSRASASSQRPTARRREDGRGYRTVTSSQGCSFEVWL
jgi:hypothetical protein